MVELGYVFEHAIAKDKSCRNRLVLSLTWYVSNMLNISHIFTIRLLFVLTCLWIVYFILIINIKFIYIYLLLYLIYHNLIIMGGTTLNTNGILWNSIEVSIPRFGKFYSSSGFPFVVINQRMISHLFEYFQVLNCENHQNPLY